ncbi:MAG: MBL fold metallo-hydrolase [Thermoguttaceae bacterium]|nr:MBL fold metallo-hydrolase [Thermoguttaceae bacterium]
MKIKQIRNATLRIEYAGVNFLIDPWLAPIYSCGCFASHPGRPFHATDPVKERILFPMAELPESVDEILRDVHYYLTTHIHPDHIDVSPDGLVGAPLDKTLPTLVQNEADAEAFKRSGFQKVSVLSETPTNYGAATLTKTPARHGTATPCGEACGVLFRAPNEKTLYLAGDTIFYEGVQKTLTTCKPDVVILNACAAELQENGRLIVNDEDVESVAKTAPDATLILSHMDVVPHASITRCTMRGLMARRGIKDYYMPEDGETLEF